MDQQKKFVGVGVVLLLLSGCSFTNRLKSRNELNIGVQAFANNDYETSIKHFKVAIELDPEFLVPYSYMATAYSAMFVPGSAQPENLEIAKNAIITFEEVLERSPDDVNAIVNIAAIYYQLADHDQSRQWCRKILEKEPDNAEALYRIGVINFDISNDATGMTGDLVDLMEDEEKEKIIEVIAEGVNVLEDAIEINPAYFDAMHYLNLLYREEAKFAADQSEENEILLKADGMALKAMALERTYLEREKATRVIKDPN